MSSSPQTVHAKRVQHQDDYRDGFIDALMYQRGIGQPTASQIEQAIATLTALRAKRKAARRGSEDEPSAIRAAELRLWKV